MFDKICDKLFGIGKEAQEKFLVKMMIISMVVFLVAIILHVNGAIALVLLIWGWRAMCACIGVTRIGKFFQYNVVIIVLAIAIWLALGVFAGLGVFIIGIIKLIQLKVVWHKEDKNL